MTSSNLRIALAQYPLVPYTSIEDWQKNTTAWVDEATHNNARVLVFPEYCSTDLGAITGAHANTTANELIFDLQKYKDSFVQFFCDLARKHKIYIAAGTFPCLDGEKYFNRCYFMGPNGVLG